VTFVPRVIELGILWRDGLCIDRHAPSGLGHEEDHLRAAARAEDGAQVYRIHNHSHSPQTPRMPAISRTVGQRFFMASRRHHQ